MDMTIIMKFIKPEFLILVAMVWCLGLFLKRIPAFKAEWLIPLILLGAAVFMSIVFEMFILKGGFNPVSVITGTIQGVLIAAVAVFGNEVIKQVLDKRLDDKREDIKAYKPEKKA